jgi:putative membrane protein
VERAQRVSMTDNQPFDNIPIDDVPLTRVEKALITIIIVFHVVGLIGLSISTLRPLFLQLVPWHLLLMLVVLVISHKPFNLKFLLFLVLICSVGFSAEWAGVHTGWLFGSYTYGDVLGVKWDGVPLIIGVNWFLLIYSAGVIQQRSLSENPVGRAITGAIILVLLDALMEVVAVRLGYWHWAGDSVPFKNYISWSVISAVMLFAFEKFHFAKQSIVATVFLLVQFVFFGVLHFL